MSTNGRLPPEIHAALDYALRYAREGVPAICVRPPNMPRYKGKEPLHANWQKTANTCDPAVLQKWARETPGCNFGLAMGHSYGEGRALLALDFDDPSVFTSGKIPYLPETRLHRTPSGCQHAFYTVPESTVILNSRVIINGVKVPIDIRYKGAQVVCPGSWACSSHAADPTVPGQYNIDRDGPIAPLPDEWLELLTKPQKAAAPATVNGSGHIPPGDQDVRLFKLAAAMQRQGATEDAMMAAMREEVNRFEQRPGDPWTEVDFRRIARSAGKYPPAADAPPPQSVQAMFNDKRAKVFMPGDDLEMGDVATTLAKHLRGVLYVHNREVVSVEGDRLHVISVQEFRTLVQKTLVCLRKRAKEMIRTTTMTFDDSRGILASPQLREGLETVAQVNTVRLPVRHETGSVELLPEGYDEATRTWTASWTTYAEDMDFAEAQGVIRDLFRDFSFADKERSLSVSVAALLAPFAAQLVSRTVTRPIFVVTKNAPGAGAGTLVSCCLVPIMGGRPTGTFPHKEEEMRKRLTSEVRAGATVIVFDNVTGLFDSQELAAFATLALWRDRSLGTNEMCEGENNAIVYATMNNAAVSEQMGRRSLFMELHLAEERAEDRTFVRELNTDTLRAMAPRILAACWALVRNWDTQGRPGPSRINSNFPEWSRVLGGIVEAAGFGCPLARADVAEHADASLLAMRALVAVMEVGRRYSFQDILEHCRREEIFLENNGDPDPRAQPKREASEQVRLGFLLASYGRPPGRKVGNYRFLLSGTNRGRRYYIEAVTSDCGGGNKN